jgi:hypothetical protein
VFSKYDDYNFFTEEYEHYIRNIWDGGNGQKAIDSSFLSRLISAHQASKLLGMRPKNFSILIREGLLEGKVIKRPKYNLILIDKLSLENFKEKLLTLPKNKYIISDRLNEKSMKEFVTVEEATKKLETSRTTIIKITKDHSIRHGRRIFIQKSFVDNLEDLIKNKSKIFGNEPDLINFYYCYC